MTELRTDRLILRPLTEDDIDVMLAIRNEPRVIPSTGTGEELPRERMEGQITRWLDLWRERELGTRIILLDDAPVGSGDERLYELRHARYHAPAGRRSRMLRGVRRVAFFPRTASSIVHRAR